MTPREIISVGPAWATEAGNKVVVATQADHMMLREVQNAYHLGYERGKRDNDAGFIAGLIWGSVVWVIGILFARAI